MLLGSKGDFEVMVIKKQINTLLFKVIALSILFMSLIIVNPVLRICEAKYTLPENIRIGLYFGKTAVDSINISSESGLEFGYEKAGEFVVLLQNSELKNVVIKKVDNVEGKLIKVLSEDEKEEILRFEQLDTYLRILPIKGSVAIPLIAINKAMYRGEVEIKRVDESDMTVINYVSLEEYLYGVLPSEMGGLWPIEALKAQAVAARTYAALNMNKYQKFGFNLCTTQSSQVYRGYKIEHPNSNNAVGQTKGRVLTYMGKPALTFYFSTSGGHTENVANVWGSTDYPYLSGVPDEYEPTEKSTYGIWNVELTPEKIQGYLSERGHDIGEIISINPVSYSEANRVIKLHVVGTLGERIFERERTRTIFGGSIYSQMYRVYTDSDFYLAGQSINAMRLTSAGTVKVMSASGISASNPANGNFALLGAHSQKSIPVIPKLYTFKGRGWGHGVGMSQWGARGMSEAGFTYDKILMHYFPGTVVE